MEWVPGGHLCELKLLHIAEQLREGDVLLADRRCERALLEELLEGRGAKARPVRGCFRSTPLKRLAQQ